MYGGGARVDTSVAATPAPEAIGGLNMAGVANKWGASGFISGGAAAAPAPASLPACAACNSALTPTYNYSNSGGSFSPAPAVPAAPRELSEKEKMAAALFGGIAPKAASPAPAYVPAAPPPAPPPVPTQIAPPSEAPPKEKKKKKKADIPAASPPIASGGGGEMDLLGDLLGDLSTPSAPSPPAGPPPAAMAVPPPGVGLGGDLFGLLDGPAIGSTPSTPAPAAGQMNMGLAVSGVKPATQLPSDARQVEMDARIRVFATTSIHPDRTDVSVYLQEQTPMGLRNIAVQLEPPSCLRTTVSAAPPAEARAMRVTLLSLHSTTSLLMASSVCVQPLTSEVAILGQLSYADPQAAIHAQLN